jgi:hypothetical protein
MKPHVPIAALLVLTSAGRVAAVSTQANVPVELTFTAEADHADPFHTVALDVVFVEPDNSTRRVPAFWAGGPGRHVTRRRDQAGTAGGPSAAPPRMPASTA